MSQAPRDGGAAAPVRRAHDPFGLDALDRDWLASKPGVKWTRHAPALAAWVADMDFPPAPAVLDAVRAVVDSGDLGYPHWPTYTSSCLPPVFAERMARRFDWSIDPVHTIELNDVLHGLHVVLHLCTEPGDGIVLHTPAYHPFLDTIDQTRLRMVETQAQMTDGRWQWDHDELDHRLESEPARILLLCNPQNPTGRVFTRAELERLAVIADRHDLLVVSDEIHSDLVYSPHVHIPMATIVPDRTVTLTSASKAFNIAGLRWAIAHIGPAWLRERIAALPGHLFGAPNLTAVAATHAAWTQGDDWLAAVMARLDANRSLLADLLRDRLAGVAYVPPEATYLAWLDARALGLTDEPAVSALEAGVALSPGADFGTNGSGFVRLNMATSPDVLGAVVDTMAVAWGPGRRRGA
jgi:cystathionine beta-lyase